MKQYFVGAMATCFAIVCFAFSTKESEGPDCTTTTYYWFKVNPAIQKTSCSSILRTDFSEVLDPNQNGVIDAGEPAVLLAAGDIEQGNASIFPFGCPDVPPFVCAMS